MLILDGVEMVDVREAAEIAGRTTETVRRWVWSGRIPATRHANRLLVSRRDLIALVSVPRVEAESASSLRAWAQDVRGTHVPGRKGRSARDLVIDDRAQREGQGSRARR